MMRKYWKQALVFFFAVGFFCGILVVNLCSDTYFRTSGIQVEEIWKQVENGLTGKNKFMWYLLFRRMGLFLLFWLMGHTIIGIFVLSAYVVWLGCAVGILLTLSFVQLGARGILLTVACLLPQDLFYGTALVRLFQNFWDRENWNFPFGVDFGKNGCRREGVVLLLNLPLMIAGILLECYVNPSWMGWLTGW